MSKTKKPRKDKKYNPAKTATAAREEFYKKIWISDSSMQDKAIVHNAGHPIAPPDFLSRWIRALNDKPFMWRFVFYGFDAEAEDYMTAEMPLSKPYTSLEIVEVLNQELQGFLNSPDHDGLKIDSWGWVAVPSPLVDIDAMVLAWGEYFEGQDIYNIEKIESARVIRQLGD